MRVRPRLVEMWNDASVAPEIVVRAVRSMLAKYVTTATLQLADVEFNGALTEELLFHRNSGARFASSGELLRLTGQVLVRVCHRRSLPIPMEVQDLLSASPRSRLEAERFVAFRSDNGVKSVDLIIPS